MWQDLLARGSIARKKVLEKMSRVVGSSSGTACVRSWEVSSKLESKVLKNEEMVCPNKSDNIMAL